METTHTPTAEAETADEVLFGCLSCPRRLVVGKRTGRPVVIDQGDDTVTHVGGTASVGMQVPGIVP